jgi:hypothetical protein
MPRLGGVAFLARPLLRGLLFALVILSISGCAVRLVPDFDRTIVDGLSKANEQTQVFLASVQKGTKPSGFSARKTSYNSLIGQFEALRVQAAARPAPPPLRGRVLARLNSTNFPDGQLPAAPTPAILAAIVSTLTVMRDGDEEFALTSGDVARFKTEYEISIGQALTYEKALEMAGG